MTVAAVMLWGVRVGAVSAEPGEAAVFRYDPEFVRRGVEASPLAMPLSDSPRSFPELPQGSFRGLPGLLADSLPDSFGTQLIAAWLESQGRALESMDVVDRLCYTGSRGMGALEYVPAAGPSPQADGDVSLAALVDLASRALTDRSALAASVASEPESAAAMHEILRVGTSAGGARAKAVIAWNPETGQVRSGQAEAGAGFEHWLLKLDGVSGNRDLELADPQGFGAIEFAYSEMARAAGISMSECRLLEENGRRHFMTRRFDRAGDGSKLHMQSLAAIRHFDYRAAGANSYEQALLTIRRLGIPAAAVEEQFRRMVFNIVARNQDDHVKNIAFLMGRDGVWSLSPAFDVSYSYNPDGAWTAQHQMTANGKRGGFDAADLDAVARTASLRRGAARRILAEVAEAVAGWTALAAAAGVPEAQATAIAATHRLALG